MGAAQHGYPTGEDRGNAVLARFRGTGLELIQVRKLYSGLNIEFIASQENSTGEFYDVERIL
jgi:hypothetical protein